MFLFFVLVLQIVFLASSWPMVSRSIGVALACGVVHVAAGAVTQGGGVAEPAACCGSTLVSTTSWSLWKVTWIRSVVAGAGVLAERLKHQAMQKISMTRLQIAAP